jgi:Ca-activated chloride channel family protein
MKKRMLRWVLVMFALSTALFLSGCATVIQRIQQTTGSKIEKVDELATEEQNADRETEEVNAKESDVPKSPAPYIELEDILKDEGRGEYAGDNYDRNRVMDALSRMPKGLADDKAYAYLLGLVGENYQKDVEMFDSMRNLDYHSKLEAWREFGTKEKPPVNVKQPAEGQVPEKPAEPKKLNLVVLLDTSGSMRGKLAGKSKMEWAKQAVTELAGKLPKDNGSLELRLYGHKGSSKKEDKDVSCSSTEKVYGPEKPDPNRLKARIGNVKPAGYTPLALAIDSAGRELPQGGSGVLENQLLVISDGYENCGGDPVRAAKEIHKNKAISGIHVIGLDVEKDSERDLRQVADVTGGDYQQVEKPEDLKETLGVRAAAFQRIQDPWQLRALDALIKAHRFDEKRLNRHHAQMMEKVRREYIRLDEANNFIKAQGKIDGETWKEIGEWIDQRWKQLGGYADTRWKEIGLELDRKWEKEYRELQKDWQQQGGNQGVLEQKASQQLNENQLKQMIRDVQLREGIIRQEIKEAP